ncbi:MAG: hypothetical protein ACFBSG_20790 [Leptolyngbyaceae cyanobacterium]
MATNVIALHLRPGDRYPVPPPQLTANFICQCDPPRPPETHFRYFGVVLSLRAQTQLLGMLLAEEAYASVFPPVDQVT